MDDRPEDPHYVAYSPLVDLFRLGSTFRWQVVHMAKDQTVAEHSHMTAILVVRICQILEVPPEDYVMHAIFHDAEEAWIGDVATPAKRLMDKSKLPVGKMLGPFARYYTPPNDLVRAVVKLADDVEALRYLSRYAQHKHGYQVSGRIAERLTSTMKYLRGITPSRQIAQIDVEMSDYIAGRGETFADDYI